MSTPAANNTNSVFVFPGSAQRATGHSQHPPPALQRMDWFQHHHHHHHQVNDSHHDDSTPTNQNNNNSSSNSATMMIENPLLRNLRTPLASIQPTTTTSSNNNNTDSNQQQQHMKSPPSTAHSTASSLQPFSPFSPPPPSFLNLRRNTNSNNSNNSPRHHPVVDTDVFRHDDATTVGLRQRNVRSMQNPSNLTDENDTTNSFHHGDSSKKKIKGQRYIGDKDPMSNPTSASSSSYSLGNVPTLFALARPPSHDTAAVPSASASSPFRYQTPSSWPLSSTTTTETTTTTQAPVVVLGNHGLWVDPPVTKNQSPGVVVTEQDITWGPPVTTKVHSIVPHDAPDIVRPSTRNDGNDDDDENVTSWCERIVRYLFRMDE